MKQISVIDFYILHYLSTQGEKTQVNIFNYVNALALISRQAFYYKLNSLYTKYHLIKETYKTSCTNDNSQTIVYYELTDTGIACYNEVAQTLKVLLITS